MRTNILILIGCGAVMLAGACGDDDDSGRGGSQKQDAGGSAGSGGHGAGGRDGGSHATMDASMGSGGSASGPHNHGGSGGSNSSASDSGAAGATADNDGGDTSSGGSGAHDAGSDSGSGSGGTGAGSGGSGSCNVMCNGKCCAANQVCGTEPPKTVSAGWGANAGNIVLHVVQGSTVTFSAGTFHNVWLLTNEANYTSCDFTGATELAMSGTYQWSADTLGDFYFGCNKIPPGSSQTHCASEGVKKHIVVETPGPACVNN